MTAQPFTAVRRIEFADTDAAGVAHFTTYFRLMEETEHAFYRFLGGSAFEETGDSVRGMPRVSASCDFVRPLRYGDVVEVVLRVREKGERKIAYNFEFRAHPDRRLAAKGAMTVVHATRTAGETFKSAPIPAFLREATRIARARTGQEGTPP